MKANVPAILGAAGKKSAVSFLPVLSLLLIWWGVSAAGLVNQLLLPSPIRVFAAVQDLGPSLITHVGMTTLRVLVGLIFGILAGTLLGGVMQFNRTAFLLLDGLIETARPIPPIALVPFFLLIFGFAEVGKVLLVVIGTGLVIAVATIEAIERVPPGLVRWGLVSGLSRFQLFRFIIVPAAFPEMKSGIRIALALSVALVIASEFMGAKSGLGYLINVSKVTLATPTIFLAILILGWLSWCLDLTVRLIFDRNTKWETRARGATR